MIPTLAPILPAVRMPVNGFNPGKLSPGYWGGARFLTGLSAGQPVDTLADKSGSGNNAIQSLMSAQPLFQPGVLNGAAGLQFDGVDDWLTIGNVCGCTTAVTIFIVVDSGDGTGPIQVGTEAGNAMVGMARDGGTNDWLAFIWAAGQVNSGVTAAGPLLLEATWNAGGLISLWVNGTFAGSAAASSFDVTGGGTNIVGIGGYISGRFITGYIGEVVIYPVEMVATPRGLVRKYLNDIYHLF